MRTVICRKDFCELSPKNTAEQEGGGLSEDDYNYAVSLRGSTEKKRGRRVKRSEQKGGGFPRRRSSRKTIQKKLAKKSKTGCNKSTKPIRKRRKRRNNNCKNTPAKRTISRKIKRRKGKHSKK